ncbi:hypothetical protein BVU76_14595 [Mycolicibacterium porcinum]|nr:hypothetical protein BVU76_14595 [Mycolicibacterium porcinum]
MTEEISQRELRNDSGRVLRALDEGKTFVITRNRQPVGELRPLHRRRLVDAHIAVELFRHAPTVDGVQFRADLDALADQDPASRV